MLIITFTADSAKTICILLHNVQTFFFFFVFFLIGCYCFCYTTVNRDFSSGLNIIIVVIRHNNSPMWPNWPMKAGGHTLWQAVTREKFTVIDETRHRNYKMTELGGSTPNEKHITLSSFDDISIPVGLLSSFVLDSPNSDANMDKYNGTTTDQEQ